MLGNSKEFSGLLLANLTLIKSQAQSPILDPEERVMEKNVSTFGKPLRANSLNVLTLVNEMVSMISRTTPKMFFITKNL
jgi:hypothetical protein